MTRYGCCEAEHLTNSFYISVLKAGKALIRAQCLRQIELEETIFLQVRTQSMALNLKALFCQVALRVLLVRHNSVLFAAQSGHRRLSGFTRQTCLVRRVALTSRNKSKPVKGRIKLLVGTTSIQHNGLHKTPQLCKHAMQC